VAILQLRGELQAAVPDIRIESNPLRELPERFDAVVRLAQDAKAKNADGDEQDDDNGDGDEKLALDRHGDARHRTGDCIVSEVSHESVSSIRSPCLATAPSTEAAHDTALPERSPDGLVPESR
jgi:hypothetical protein